ncbi:hypothetical protein [Agrobacterium sp. fls2-241-TYG-188a]|uniref:hypothetical protein n=1 Tax=Agrobacterium sp. fls2-241-TYG-188a TaxID=3040275 RepID=UPI00254DB162|nr:hypothetical protein [Agrobacterium sp. fls2-241-TYG-188a]
MRQGKHRSRIGPRQKLLRFHGIEFCADNGVVEDAWLVGWVMICLPRPDIEARHYIVTPGLPQWRKPGLGVVEMATVTN